jgi:phage gpG-like protein
MLWLHGTLLRSLAFGADGNVWNQTGNSITLGSSVKYAARQNFGGHGIPARPYLTTSDEAMQKARDAFIAAISRAVE